MKRYFLPCILLLLSSCSETTYSFPFEFVHEVPKEYPDDNYIKWDEMFSIEEHEYYVYVFSKSCKHCNEIKENMLDFASNSTNKVYFLEYCSDVKIGFETELTIGVETIENMFVKGTPSLIYIVNGKVNKNLGGTKEISKVISLP